MLTQKKKKLSVVMLTILYGSLVYAAQPSSISAAQPAIQENLEHQATLNSKAPIVKVEASQALLTYQLVQTLSKTTIFGSRMLEGMNLAKSNVILPDPEGSPVADHISLAVSQDAGLYRITYLSTDTKGRPTTLSGLVVVPLVAGKPGDASDGLIVYMHSTTADRANAPGDRSVETYAAIANFAGEKWVLAMPDYLGYGANRQPHPYALAKLNAMSGASMILATHELLAYLKFPSGTIGSQINVTGFSEGGGNAMGLGRYLQENWGKPVKIAPMAGPYDLSGATAQSFIAPQQQAAESMENTEVKPTLLAFSGIATSQALGQPSWKLLLDPIAQQAKGMFPGPYADDDVGAKILTTGINDLDYLDVVTFTPHPERLLQPQLTEAIKSNDLSNPAMKLWADNDMVDWGLASPTETKIYMLGALQDPLVPFASKTYPLPLAYKKQKGLPAPYAAGNAENVIRAMRAKGYGPDTVSWLGFNGLVMVHDPETEEDKPTTVMGHSGSFEPSIIMAAEFFRGKTPLKDMPHLNDPK